MIWCGSCQGCIFAGTFALLKHSLATRAILILYIIILSFFVFSPLSGAQEQKEQAIILTLDEAITIALRDNREILLNQERLTQAKLKIEETKGAFLPEVNLGAGATETRGLYKKDINNYSFQGSVKQYFYKGGKAVNSLKQAKDKKDIQAAVLEKNVSDTAVSVKKAFYTLLIAWEFAQVNRLILDNAKGHFESIEARYHKGEAPESELLKLRAQLANFRSLYESSLYQEENAKSVLKNSLALEEKTDIDIKGSFKYSHREIAVDEAILKALELRPEIKQYAAQSRSDEAEVEISKSANRPSIYGSFDYYSRSTTSLSFSPSKGWQDYNVIGFSLSWPIFDGLATSRKVEGALSILRQDKILEGKLKADIATQVKEAYLSLKTGLARLKPRKRDIEVYQDNLKIIQAKYNDGLASELDLGDARLALWLADFNQKQALYDCLIAKAKLDNVMGVNPAPSS